MQLIHDTPSILDVLADCGEPRRSPPKPRKLSPDEEFEEFHRRNPQVYDRLLVRSLEAKRAGLVVGLRCVWEVMRWDLSLATSGTEFKLNDHLTSRYARLLMQQVPELRGFFETRERSKRGAK